jgi:DNA polymerase-3 subunit delta
VAEFYEKLNPDKLASVYILVSQEPLLLDRAQEAIRDAAVPPDLRGFNVDQLSGKGGSADQISNIAQTLPMMAKRRLVVVRGLEALPADELSKLAVYLDEPNPSTVLMGVCAKVDKRLKFFQKAKKLKMLHELTAPKRVGPWIRNEAERLEVNIAGAAADRLADVVGSDLARLGLSLQQLALYAGDRQVVVDDVDDLIADTRERSVFELTGAIANRDHAGALQAVNGLFEQRQSSIGVVMMLARHMRQVGLCQAGMEERLSGSDLARRVGVPPFVLDKLRTQAGQISVRSVAESMRLLGHADQALKGYGQSTKVLGRVVAERVIVEGLVSDLIRLSK